MKKILILFTFLFASTAHAGEYDFYMGKNLFGLHVPTLITAPYVPGGDNAKIGLFGDASLWTLEYGEFKNDGVQDGDVTVTDMSFTNKGITYRSFTDISLWFLNFNWFLSANRYEYNLAGDVRIADGSNSRYDEVISSSISGTVDVGCLGFGSSWTAYHVNLGIDWYGYCSSTSSTKTSTGLVESDSDLKDMGETINNFIGTDKYLIISLGLVF